MTNPKTSPVAESVVEQVALAIAQKLHGPDFDPFANAEAFDFACEIARAAIAAMPRSIEDDAPTDAGEADEGPCTDCDDTGLTIQTERACSCDAGEQYRPTDAGKGVEPVAWMVRRKDTGEVLWDEVCVWTHLSEIEAILEDTVYEPFALYAHPTPTDTAPPRRHA